ncbi:hypothetical protein SAMN05216330_105250 [Bradyrhizobium sp. Ghvi]|nr:hypothetical protein SAMN05216330_105250 [Bradyrhizobium sp. Ghvi]
MERTVLRALWEGLARGLGRAISLNADGMVWGDVPASDVRQLVPFAGVQGRAALLH